MKEKNKETVKKIFLFVLNPRLLICWGLAWIITNGWSYAILAIGTWLDINWMKALAGGYIAFLWLPVSPEKIVTAAIAIFLLRLLFPHDQKTLAVLRNIYDKARTAFKRYKDKLTRKNTQ